MGCDGGSIPRRDELVKLKKKAEKVDPAELERIKWFTCAMSNDKLKEPIVVCELGRLYNKEAVIRALLEKNLEEKFSYIRNLKDLITPRFTPNPAFKVSTTDTDNSASRSPFICPVSQVEVGHAPFAIIRTCGCVLSERALREVPSSTCLQCGVAFTADDVITMNPTPEVRAELRTRMEMKRAQEKNKKKEKREKRREKKDIKEKVGEEGAIRENGENALTIIEKEGEIVQDKKGKKREAEPSAPIDLPSKAAKLSTKTTTTTTTTTTSSSSSSSSTTSSSSSKRTTTYTANVVPRMGGEAHEKDVPATITVAKTSAYTSLFQAKDRTHKGSNYLFSGIY